MREQTPKRTIEQEIAGLKLEIKALAERDHLLGSGRIAIDAGEKIIATLRAEKDALSARCTALEQERERRREASEAVLAAWPLDGTDKLSLADAIQQLRAALSSTPTPEHSK